jgi:hypothetical protein
MLEQQDQPLPAIAVRSVQPGYRTERLSLRSRSALPDTLCADIEMLYRTEASGMLTTTGQFRECGSTLVVRMLSSSLKIPVTARPHHRAL